MSDTIRLALAFLIDSLFNLFIFTLVIRLILAWVRSDYFNPITQFVVKVTNFIVKPMRRIMPNIGNFETATFVALLITEMVKFLLSSWINFGEFNYLSIPVFAVADICYLFIQTFKYAIILQVILSFLQPMSPLTALLQRFNSPVLRPFQRLIPPINGIDLSPIPAIICLQLLNMLLVVPLMSIAQGVAFG